MMAVPGFEALVNSRRGCRSQVCRPQLGRTVDSIQMTGRRSHRLAGSLLAYTQKTGRREPCTQWACS